MITLIKNNILYCKKCKLKTTHYALFTNKNMGYCKICGNINKK